MPFYIYNAAPGPMYFRGNEIKAETGRWTEVSPISVNYGTFNTMRRLGHLYLVETATMPTYNPNHPDNKARVEADAPGAKEKIAELNNDGGMSEAEMKVFLAKKNTGGDAAVDTYGPKELGGSTDKLSFDDLGSLGADPVTEAQLEVQPEAPAELVKAAKTTKAKAAKANIIAATEVSAAIDMGPPAEGNWS